MSELLGAETGSGELPVEVVENNNDSCTSSQQHQQQPKQVASASLKRHSSTPARIKDGYVNNQLEDSCSSPSLQTKSTMTRYHQHRLSDSAANHTSHAKHTTCSSSHTQAQVSDCQPSKTTSSSSSASDSAFSRSQTTLKSSESVSYSRGSLKESFLRRDKKNRKVEDEKSFNEDPDHNSNTSKYDKNQHFEIVWKNLSFRVPEKRFYQISAQLYKLKDAVCSSKQNHQEQVTEKVSDDSSNISSSSSEDPDELRSPTVGKPRPVIFENLNGHAKSGELTAILGPSGAGKTTFLKCLTNSHVRGVTGSIDIKGGIGASQRLKLCIIPQKDYLFDYLTVMENLTFASRIKNTQKNFNHKQNVDRVANLLGLQSCLNLKTKKLSGGQYKRVSIAQELLSNPDILVLDEPTSGLDSLTCFRTVNVLRDLVDMSQKGIISPLAIIMTIHQPQIKIFNSFHHVYILSSMGQCVYEGKPENLVDTVADCCKLLPPPDDLNPATFIIDLASEVFGPEPIKELNDLQQRNSITYEAHHYHHHDSKIKDDQNKQDSSNIIFQVVVPLDGTGKQDKNINLEQGQCNQEELMICERLKRRYSHKGNFWLHTNLLIKRLWISSWRDPLLTTTRVMFHLIIPFVFYFIYSQKSGIANACPYVEREFDFQAMTSDANIDRLKVQHNELILTFENVSLFFLLLYSFSMCVLAVTALSFPLNMQILLKETGNGWYSMSRFVMAKTLADLPLELAMPMVSVAIAYVLTGQPSSYLCWRMLTVTAVMTLCSLISQTQGLLFGAYFMNNVQAAVFISQASSLPWIMLSGFTTRISELPTILQWLSFGSIYRLGIESIVAVRYGFGICPCDTEIVNSTPPKLVGIPDQIKSVISYYMDVYKEPGTGVAAVASTATTNSTSSTVDVFEKIASTLSRANTYGVDIVNCHDVRPFILSAREVDEGTLPMFLAILVSIFIGLKIMLFCVVKLRAA